MIILNLIVSLLINIFSYSTFLDISIYEKWKIKSNDEINILNDSIKNSPNYTVTYYNNLLYYTSESFGGNSNRKFILNQIETHKKLSTIEIFEQYGSGEIPYYMFHIMETSKKDTIKYYFDALVELKPKKYKNFYIENTIYSNFRDFDVLSYLKRNVQKTDNQISYPTNFIAYTKIINEEVVDFKIICNVGYEAIDSIYSNRIHSK